MPVDSEIGIKTISLMRFEGTLKSWNDERGFGFIEPDQGGDDIFVHIKTIVNRQGRPMIGQRFTFEIELGSQGKKRAKAVLPARPIKVTAPGKDSPARWGTATLFAIPAFLLMYLAVSVAWRPTAYIALAYLLLSLITFAAYALDKAAAARGDRRTPEATLHVLALAGGWSGALLAQQFLRHKSAKQEFRTTFWLTAVINVVAFFVLCSPIGRSVLGHL